MACLFNMSKPLFILLLSITLASLHISAQEYQVCVYHYFNNKKVSTSQCFDKDKRWGKALAYDKTGKIIYEKELRRVAGNSSVDFTYYPDGAVSRAQWHSAPDAGIQWYNSTTYFSKDGTIEKVEENSYDMTPGLKELKVPGEYTPQIKKQEAARCGAIYSTEFYFINKYKYPVNITATRKGNAADIKTVTVNPGDTAIGGSFIMTEQFVELSDYYTFSAIPTKTRKGRSYSIVLCKVPGFETISKATRRYHYVALDM
ncbi:hypothetical protein [Flavipsychrobacter stenotrophus]|nr:hypothetical protein [Flavipsychrobacter stenotrophus]